VFDLSQGLTQLADQESLDRGRTCPTRLLEESCSLTELTGPLKLLGGGGNHGPLALVRDERLVVLTGPTEYFPITGFHFQSSLEKQDSMYECVCARARVYVRT